MMWKPVTAERWGHFQRMTAVFDDAGVEHSRPREVSEIIRSNVEWLLDHLYDANAENGYRASGERIATLGLDDEAINWGDLHCSEVNDEDGHWTAYIEETAEDSPNLRAYVTDWLKKWGWEVEVETAW